MHTATVLNKYPPPARLYRGANNFRVIDDFVRVDLSQGVVGVVDVSVWDVVRRYRWCAYLSGDKRDPRKLTRWVMRARHANGKVLAHRLIADLAGLSEVAVVDHAHHYPVDQRLIDNTLSNLRPATLRDNNHNRRSQTRWKGIQLLPSDRYRASINTIKGRQHLGVFDTPEEAARAYDAAAREQFGEFALLNFPAEEQVPF